MPINGIESELCQLHFWTGGVTRRLATEFTGLPMSDRTKWFAWVTEQTEQAKLNTQATCRAALKLFSPLINNISEKVIIVYLYFQFL